MQRKLILMVVIVLSVGYLEAQDRGRVGFDISTDPSLGLTWHFAEFLAVRPTFTFSTTSADFIPMSLQQKANSNAIGFGLSLLAGVYKKEHFTFYMGPNFSYSRSKSTSDVAVSPITNNNKSIGGFLGARYSLIERIDLYGEIGPTYSTTETDAPFSISPEVHSWSLRSRIGILIYFN